MKTFNHRWFKGNVHLHTSKSDGKLPLDLALDWYRTRGYDFVAITDHSIFTAGEKIKDFLVLSGIELTHHTVGLGMTDWDEETTASQQDEIDKIVGHGGVAIVGHPYWHGLSMGEVEKLQGYHHIEVYNSECDVTIGRGYSSVHWDYLLDRGRRLGGLAVDDSHWKHGNEGMGWICVNAPSLDPDTILAQIREGNFYSSQGPQINQVYVEKDEVSVECSPVKRINFVSNKWAGSVVLAENGSIERASFKLSQAANYIRIECIDAEGRLAWSNPIFL